jgi:GNAT superfamily N-acetyltransferase
MCDSVVVKEVNSENSNLHKLIFKLDNELKERYPEEGIFGLNFNDPKVNEIVFVVAYINDYPVGCGSICPLDLNSAELKRFYVDSKYRKKGIASKILSFLEYKAKNKGYSTIKLETGPFQPESIELYKKFGYINIELYGKYVNSKYSICFEKILY